MMTGAELSRNRNYCVQSPPLILQVLAPDRVFEAEEFSIQVIARDPGNDPITYAYDLDGDGVFERAAPDLSEVELSFR